MRPPDDFVKVGATMEAAGIIHSLFYSTGVPGAAAVPTPGLGGTSLTTYAGQLPFTNPGSGNSYLARLAANSTGLGTVMLVDRLWHNSGFTITTTTAQTINSTAWPARDRDGATSGENVMVGIEVSTVTGNAGAITNTTMSYTNESGTASKTATMASFPITGLAGTFVPFELAAGDRGVRSIQTVTLGTSYVSGVIHLVAFRVLAVLPITDVNSGNAIDALTGGFVRMYDNTVPYLLWLPSSTTAVNVWGQLTVTQG